MSVSRLKEKIETKKSKRRLKVALFFLVFLIFIALSGFLVRSFKQDIFYLFRKEKIIAPISGKTPIEELSLELKKAEIQVISFSLLNEREFEASLSGGTKVFLKSEEITRQITSLQVMLSRFKIEGRRPQKIDLRFEKPIVVF